MNEVDAVNILARKQDIAEALKMLMYEGFPFLTTRGLDSEVKKPRLAFWKMKYYIEKGSSSPR